MELDQILELTARASEAGVACLFLEDPLGLRTPVRFATLRRLRRCRRYLRQVGAVATVGSRWIELKWSTGRLRLSSSRVDWQEARDAIAVRLTSAELAERLELVRVRMAKACAPANDKLAASR